MPGVIALMSIVVLPAAGRAEPLWSLSLGQGNTFSDTGLVSASPGEFDLQVDERENFQLHAGRYFEPIKSDHTTVDLFVARQRSQIALQNNNTQASDTTALDSLHIQLGGSYQFAYTPRLRPFIGMALGGSRLAARDYDTLHRISFSFNAGASLLLTPALALRLDARALGIVLDSRAQIFCAGGCVASVEGNLWLQYSTAAALEFRF